jgi:Putative adhesin
MPVFTTPEPISVTIELSVGNVRLVASDRADTVVEVRPSDESDDSDVQAAQQTRVEYADGTLTVRGPKSRVFDFSKKTRSVSVLVELPTGSAVHGDTSVGDVHSTGVLGECRLKASVGQFRLDGTGPLRLNTTGHIAVGTIAGDAEVANGSGRVDLGEIGGAAVIKNSNGNINVGAVAGDLRARTANGDISVDRAGAAVEAKSSNGSIRIGEVARDAVTLDTANGDLEIGVAAGTAAWLDLKTGHGRVRNALDDIGQGPQKSEETVEVRAHTSFGDITVRRT